MKNKFEINLNILPYQLFFILGSLIGITGVTLWHLFHTKIIHYYPGMLHANFMINGFMLSFISGFLYTAVPKFTATYNASRINLIISLLFIFLSIIFGLFQFLNTVFILQIIIQILLCYFVFSRYFKSKAYVGEYFIFINTGVLFGLLGTILEFLYHLFPYGLMLNLAKIFLYQGFILPILVGIGTRLFSPITGHMPKFMMPKKDNKSIKSYLIHRNNILLIMIISFLIQGFFFQRIGLLLLFTSVLIIALKEWHLLEWPKRKNFHSYSIFFGIWFLHLGLLFSAIFLEYQIHLFHFIYIGCYGMITLAISTRVTLGHGGHDVFKGENSKLFSSIVFFVILTLILRICASFFGNFFLVLNYATYAWFLALIIWIYFVGKKVLYIKPTIQSK